MRSTFIALCSPFLLIAVGCGQSGGSSSGVGGDGGGGGGTGPNAPNVLGTRHDCDTMSRSEFIAACADQGGTLADGCSSGATNPCDSAGICYAPPSSPAEGEFLCDGL